MGAGGTPAGVATKTTRIVIQCQERVFARGLANLFEALVVVRAAAHSIEILRNYWMIVIWRGKPVQRLRAVVTRSCRHSETDLRSRAAELLHVRHVTHNYIRPHSRRRPFSGDSSQRGHHDRLNLAVDQLRDLDGPHRCADGDFSNG